MAETLMQKLKGKSINGKKTRITLAPVSDDDWGSNPRDRRGGRRGDRDRGGRRGGDRGRRRY